MRARHAPHANHLPPSPTRGRRDQGGMGSACWKQVGATRPRARRPWPYAWRPHTPTPFPLAHDLCWPAVLSIFAQESGRVSIPLRPLLTGPPFCWPGICAYLRLRTACRASPSARHIGPWAWPGRKPAHLSASIIIGPVFVSFLCGRAPDFQHRVFWRCAVMKHGIGHFCDAVWNRGGG